MKSVLFTFSLFVSCSVFAATSEYVLDDTEITIEENIAIIIRTDKTPDKVKINMSAPMGSFECAETQQVEVERTVMVDCAYVENNIQTEWYCSHYKRNGRCAQFVDTGFQKRPSGQLCARVITELENECTRHAEVTNVVSDDFTLDFSKLPVLQKGQKDVFRISVKQESFGEENIIWGISTIDSQVNYKVTYDRLMGIFKPRGFKFQVRGE